MGTGTRSPANAESGAAENLDQSYLTSLQNLLAPGGGPHTAVEWETNGQPAAALAAGVRLPCRAQPGAAGRNPRTRLGGCAARVPCQVGLVLSQLSGREFLNSPYFPAVLDGRLTCLTSVRGLPVTCRLGWLLDRHRYQLGFLSHSAAVSCRGNATNCITFGADGPVAAEAASIQAAWGVLHGCHAESQRFLNETGSGRGGESTSTSSCRRAQISMWRPCRCGSKRAVSESLEHIPMCSTM